MFQRLSLGFEDFKGVEILFFALEIVEDVDVGKVSSVAVGVEVEQEGLFEGNEVLDVGEVVVVGVCEVCRERNLIVI